MKRWIAVLVGGALVGAGIAAFVVLSGVAPFVETGACQPKDALARYQATDPMILVSDQPFTDATGAERTLHQYRGRGLVVNFWATWCGPCVKEMPALASLKGKLAGDGIDVITISLDRPGADAVTAFFKEHAITAFEPLVDPRSRLARKLAVSGLPTTLLVNDQGKEIGRVVGAAEWDDGAVVSTLRACLKPAAPGAPAS